MRVILLMMLIGAGMGYTLKIQYDKQLKPVTKPSTRSTEPAPEEVLSSDASINAVTEDAESIAGEDPVEAEQAETLMEVVEPVHIDPFFASNIKPFMNKYCSDCHNNTKQKGKLNLEPVHGFEANLESVELWQEMYDQLEEGDMPPEDELQPTADEKEMIMSWIDSQIDSKRDEMKNAAFTHLRRLNKFEYNRTISDLLKIDTSLRSLSRNFPADDLKENLTNNGEALQVSAFHMEAYIAAAEEAVDMAVKFDKKPPIQSYTYLPPYKKSGNVLKAARAIGKNKFIDLVEQRSFVFHSDQESGVSESGYYKVSAKLQARNREHKLDPKGFPIPQDQLLRASIVLSNPASGDANYFTSSDRTVEEFELPDEKVITISGKYWIEQGYTAKIGFPTSVPRFKSAKGKGIDSDKYPKFFKNVKGAYAKFLSSQKFMQNHGPVVRVFDVKIEGPFYEEWPIASHQNLFGNQTLAEINLDRTIDSFAIKAFRRPIRAEDTVLIKKLMRDLSLQGYSKEECLKAGLVAVLCSPQFFYLKESKGSLDNYALASRLSYFLWSTMPDEKLMAAAKSGKLSHPLELEHQVLRMIKDPKIDGFINSFADGWLQLNKLGSMPPDLKTQVYYVNDLENAGRQETIHFIKDLLINNGKITNFLNSDYTFMNKGLAAFYGHKSAKSFKFDEYRKTKITDPRRGGLLGQMSLLTATANGVDTTPIIRGMWVLENLLGEHLEAPPGVPAVEPDVRGAKTLRQMLEKHRKDKNCYACHKKIDPPGFALESFDHIGRWRNNYNEHQRKGIKLPVDSKGEMSDGQKFSGIVEFKKILMSKKRQFTRTLAEKLLTYATGREIRTFEAGEVEKIADDKDKFKDLMVAIVKSELFRRK